MGSYIGFTAQLTVSTARVAVSPGCFNVVFVYNLTERFRLSGSFIHHMTVEILEKHVFQEKDKYTVR